MASVGNNRVDWALLAEPARELAAAMAPWVFPGETEVIDPTWQVLTAYLKVNVAGRTPEPRELFRGLGVGADQPGPPGAHLAVLVAWTALHECARQGVVPTLEEIRDGVNACARRYGAPPGLADRIAATAAPVLFDQMAALPSPAGGGQSPHAGGVSTSADDDRLVVSWCDGWSDESGRIPAEVFRVIGARAEVLDRFATRSSSYAVFVNEVGALEVRPVVSRGKLGVPLSVGWADFRRAQHRRFLWLVLTSFGNRQAIDYRTIRGVAFLKRAPVRGDVPDESVRRLKAEVNEAMGGIINYSLQADRAGQSYSIVRQVPFCWIRPLVGPSRLNS